MTKYLEQTAWLLNPTPDGRKRGRWAKQSFVEGTRWEYDEKRGSVYGDGMQLEGKHAATIVANCKEVEPGFGILVNKYDYKEVIGRLIDQGKITVADIQNILREDEQLEEDDDVPHTDEENRKSVDRGILKREQFSYRHWLSLDPPSEKLIEAVAEQERIDGIKSEYAEQTGQRRSSAGNSE